MTTIRNDGRQPDAMRRVSILPGFIRNTSGSVLIELGETRVICTASVEESVPQFLRDTGRGWVTAEYGMLPGCSPQRIPRESTRGRVGGRTHEIQRLIGRSLRAVTDLAALGPRTIWIDCDVIQADGGTRTAAITGSYVALALAVRRLRTGGQITGQPLKTSVAAISVGMVGGVAMLDLCYEEDSRAEVDMNVVMTGAGQYVEIQGTAESQPFNGAQMTEMTRLATEGIARLGAQQEATLAADAAQ